MTPRLRAALAEIDLAFGASVCSPDNVCLHCYAEPDVAPLAVPGAVIDDSTLVSLMHKHPTSVTDHAALVRRLLPQIAHGFADGTVEATWPAQHCLARGDWREWPYEEARVVRRFVEAWWLDRVTTPRAGSSAPFETYAAILGDLPTALASWPEHPVADAYLADASSRWVDDLIADENPLWLSDDDDDEVCAVLRRWYLDTAADRLDRFGATALAASARTLALPPDERFEIRYGPAPTT
ncbi:hypothetical protein IF650_17145 [Cellulosimicrobium terreum]|nr:hypothetical protein [Cellulosimicrobium terreum]